MTLSFDGQQLRALRQDRAVCVQGLPGLLFGQRLLVVTSLICVAERRQLF